MDHLQFHGTLEVTRLPPHFIRFQFKVPLIGDHDLHCTLSRRIESSIAINRYGQDTGGTFHIDYTVPLHTISRSGSYMVDDMIEIREERSGSVPLIREFLRLSVLTQTLNFICSRSFPLEITEQGSWEYPHEKGDTYGRTDL